MSEGLQKFLFPGELEREGEHELPHGNVGQDAVHEMRGGVRHAPAGAARAHRSTFARERDEQIVPARVAVHPDEAVREHSAAQVRAQLLFDVARKRFVVRLARPPEERLELFTDDAVEHGLGRANR